MAKTQTHRAFIIEGLTGLRIVIAAFGTLCGLTGIIAGFFEVLQGNIAPEGIVISTIGPEYAMFEDFTYYAITIIPNIRATGILSVILSSMVILWSVKYVQRKNGEWILLVLSVAQMLVGGGWVIDLALITCILATRIDKPLNWWRSNLPVNVRVYLVRLFPFSLVTYTLISLSMLVLTVIGVNSEALVKLLELLAATMFVPILLLIFGGLTHDIQNLTAK
jgi:hypothetical protein